MTAGTCRARAKRKKMRNANEHILSTVLCFGAEQSLNGRGKPRRGREGGWTRTYKSSIITQNVIRVSINISIGEQTLAYVWPFMTYSARRRIARMTNATLIEYALISISRRLYHTHKVHLLAHSLTRSLARSHTRRKAAYTKSKPYLIFSCQFHYFS